MTVSSDTARWSYNGDGTTDTFSYTTKIFSDSDLDVYVDGTLKTLTTHYTVTGAGGANGGNVVFTTGNIPAVGTGNVVIVKDVPLTQPSSLPLGGALPSPTIEQMADRLTILVQQINKRVVRTLRQADADATDIAALPTKSNRASKVLAFDSNGDPEALAAADLDIGLVSAFVLTLLDDATAAAFMTTLGLTANGQSLVTAADYAAMRTLLSLVVGTNVQAYDADILKADTTDDLVTGFTATSSDQGEKSSGTFTPDMTTRNVQHYTNGGAHTLAPPSGVGSMFIDMTNNGSAGSVTTSGFTKVTGNAMTTTNGHKFTFYIKNGTAGSHLHIVALQ